LTRDASAAKKVLWKNDTKEKHVSIERVRGTRRNEVESSGETRDLQKIPTENGKRESKTGVVARKLRRVRKRGKKKEWPRSTIGDSKGKRGKVTRRRKDQESRKKKKRKEQAVSGHWSKD